MILRPYQTDLIAAAREKLREHRSVLIQAPTGSGKTAIASFMAKSATARGARVWFMMHRRELIKQAAAAFAANDIDFGIIAAGMPGKASPVQLCAVGTVGGRLANYPRPDLVFWDEAHHSAAQSWQRLRSEFSEAYHVGLTATPERLDGVGLGAWFESMVIGPAVADLIAAGFLAPYTIFCPSAPDMAGVATRGGDFARESVADIMDRPAITGDAVAHYLRIAPGKRAVVFAASIEHSMHVAAKFQSVGVPAAHVDGATPEGERDEAMEKFRAGEILVLSNVELFGEGVDVPGIEAVIQLRPTASLALHLQQVGRGLRPAPGKSRAIILDHAGNAIRHGLPDDVREWSLDSKKRGKKDANAVSVKVCPKCFAVARSTMRRCQCGFEWVVVAPRAVEQVDGELHEVDISAFRAARAREQAAARSLDDLVKLGVARGYRNPWAWARHLITARGGARK